MSARVLYFSCLSILLVFLVCCKPKDGTNSVVKGVTAKGGTIGMVSYPLGRFSIDVPAEMKTKGRSHRLRLTQIEEITWDKGEEHEKARNSIWSMRLEEIKKIRTADKAQSPIIQLQSFDGLGLWARGVFYHENWALEEEGVWELLVDYGPNGVWFKADGAVVEKANIEKVLRNLSNLAQAYHVRPKTGSFETGEWFYLSEGTIKLPYKWEEQTYASFEGDPLGELIEIEMKDTQIDEPKEEGLLARTAAAIATGFAAGVDIKKIRSRDRVVAGIKGEEQVVRMKDSDGVQFDFTWRSPGKKDSGEYPKILISMESPDGKIDGKLKLWDAILDSMRPLYKPLP